jgi:hypothetical protein
MDVNVTKARMQSSEKITKQKSSLQLLNADIQMLTFMSSAWEC